MLLLSETWISGKQLFYINISGFDSYHIPENKQIGVNKGRYSRGLSLYFKSELKNRISVVETNKKGLMWIKIDEGLLNLEANVYILFIYVYIPPLSSKVLNDRDFDCYAEIEKV